MKNVKSSKTPLAKSDVSSSDITRDCCACKLRLPKDAFYSKGGRLDSRCKGCVSKAKAKTYAHKRALTKAARTRRETNGYVFRSVIHGTPSAKVMEIVAGVLGGAIREVFNGIS